MRVHVCVCACVCVCVITCSVASSLLSCLPGAAQQWNQRAETESCVLIYLSAFTWRVAVFTAHTSWWDHSTQRVCACVCGCMCACLFSLTLDLLLYLIHPPVVFFLPLTMSSPLSFSRTAVSRKDFNIVLLFLESFVLFLPANLWRKVRQWVAHLYIMIFLVMSLLVISSLTVKTWCKEGRSDESHMMKCMNFTGTAIPITSL